MDKQREKEAKRKQRRDERPVQSAAKGDVDPDIAGIVPGPQPIADDQ